VAGEESSNLHQIALFTGAGGPFVMEFSAKSMYLPVRKYPWIFSNVFHISYTLITLYFVVLVYTRSGGREIFVSVLEKRTIRQAFLQCH